MPVLPRHDSVRRPQQAEAGVQGQDLPEQVFQDQSTLKEILKCEIAQARVSMCYTVNIYLCWCCDPNYALNNKFKYENTIQSRTWTSRRVFL